MVDDPIRYGKVMVPKKMAEKKKKWILVCVFCGTEKKRCFFFVLQIPSYAHVPCVYY